MVVVLLLAPLAEAEVVVAEERADRDSPEAAAEKPDRAAAPGSRGTVVNPVTPDRRASCATMPTDRQVEMRSRVGRSCNGITFAWLLSRLVWSGFLLVPELRGGGTSGGSWMMGRGIAHILVATPPDGGTSDQRCDTLAAVASEALETAIQFLHLCSRLLQHNEER